jgi:hypothetical protein
VIIIALAVTRNSKKQSHIEDYYAMPNTKSKDTSLKKNTPSKSSKHAIPSSNTASKSAPSTKRQKTSSDNQPANASGLDSMTINRSPVLHLWSACVAHFLHPELSWEACINIGSAIATLCAVSKGKAIGMIESSAEQDSEAAWKKEERKAKARRGVRRVDVVGFDLHMKGDAVIISGIEKRVKERNLIGKYGGDEFYQRAGKSIEDALIQWAGRQEELGKRAFGMYEDFRPSVPTGEKGCGRKGELRLEHIPPVRSSVIQD